MKEHGILYQPEMVRAYLAGRKTQTRRLAVDKSGRPSKWTNAKAGDVLWGRETTHRRPMLNILTGEPLDPKHDGGAYSADNEPVLTPEGFDLAWWYSRSSCPSIHMPRWASRITQPLLEVRIQRLQDISEADAMAEGIERDGMGLRHYQQPERFVCIDPRHSYRTLWDSINGEGSWDENPEIVALTYPRCPSAPEVRHAA